MRPTLTRLPVRPQVLKSIGVGLNFDHKIGLFLSLGTMLACATINTPAKVSHLGYYALYTFYSIVNVRILGPPGAARELGVACWGYHALE